MTISQAIKLGKGFTSAINILQQAANFNQVRNNFMNLRSYLHSNSSAQLQNVNNTRTALEPLLNQFLPQLVNIEKYLRDNLDEKDFIEGKNLLEKLENDLSVFKVSVPVGAVNAASATPLVNSIVPQFDTISNLQQIFSLSSKYINDVDELSNPQVDNTLSVTYEDDALITKLSELSIAAKDWGFIVNCFARLVNETDTDCEVISVKRGSLILTILAVPSIIGAICKCSDRITSSLLIIMNAKQKVLELKKLQVFTDLEIANMEKKVAVNVNKQANEVTQELLQEFMPDKTQPDYHETKAAVLKAVKMIIKFESKGGRLDARLLDSNPKYQEIVKQLKDKNDQFKLLKNNIKALNEGKNFLQLEEGSETDTDPTPKDQ